MIQKMQKKKNGGICTKSENPLFFKKKKGLVYSTTPNIQKGGTPVPGSEPPSES